MPFGIQPIHIIIIVIVALLIFGPARLPELGRSLGKGLTEFRRGAREMTDSFREEIVKTSDESSAASQQSIQPPMTTAPPPSVPPQAASPVAGNFCIQCGSSNSVDARFCNKCGARLPVEEEQSS